MAYSEMEEIVTATVFDKVELELGSFYVIGVQLKSGYQYDVNIPCNIIDGRSPELQEPIYKAVELYEETMRRISVVIHNASVNWLPMLEYGAKEIKETERQLKQIYTDRFNDGMAFGL